jgi:hypothetical protein
MDWADDNAFFKIIPDVKEVKIMSYNFGTPHEATELVILVPRREKPEKVYYETVRSNDVFNTERAALKEVEKRFKAIFKKLWDAEKQE